MKKTLTKTISQTFYYKNGERIEGVHNGINGDVSDIYGNVSGISGNVSGIRGNVSGIYGDMSDISGNIDNCELTNEEREVGVNIKDLVI